MKSRSPAPGAKKSATGGKKNELQDLVPLNTLPDGDRTYFVGGWSTEGSFSTAVTRIADENKPHPRDTAAEEPMLRFAKELDGGRFVTVLQQHPSAEATPVAADFTRVNVVILPGVGTEDAATANDASAASPLVAEVTHGMFISGMLPSKMASATSEFNARHPSSGGAAADGDAAEGAAAGDDEAAEDEDGRDAGRERPKPRYEVTYRNPAAEEEDEEEDAPVDEDGNPIVPLTPEEVAKEVEGMRKKGNSVTSAEIVDFLTNVHGAMSLTEHVKLDPQAVKDIRFKAAPTVLGGNGFAKPKRPTLYRKGLAVVDPADLVTVQGAIAFKGIRPVVTVEPRQVTPSLVATALGVSATAAVDKSGKPKRKTEEEKLKEAEMTAKLEQEGREAAQQEEERLNTFAIPDRWPTVYVSHLAFSGPVTIQQAHVRFYRCHFSGAAFANAKAFLVTLNQYCRVEFCECTFQQPSHTAIYAFPTAELFVQDCYFTTSAMPATIDAVLALSVLPPHQSPFPCTGEGAVAVHADGAKLTIATSHFEGFGNAIIVRNKFESFGRMGVEGDEEGGASPDGEPYGVSAEPNDDGHFHVRLRPTISNITDSVFINNGCSSVTFIDAKRIGLSRCYVNDDACGGYYSVQVTGSRSTPQITRCNVFGRILIGEGARPFLHKNSGKLQVVDKNQKDAPYMCPKY